MHQRRLAAATALLISAASLSGIAVAPAHAATAGVLYVDNSSPNCTDSGPGTQMEPFCFIQAAADVVQPGETVLISPGATGDGEDVVVKTSGTPSEPITFAAANGYFSIGGQDHAFTLTGVSNIVINGASASTSEDAILITGSSNITIENSQLDQESYSGTPDYAGVHVTGASNAVTIERSRFMNVGGGPSSQSWGSGIRVDGGSSGTVVATNYLDNFGQTGIAVVGASGTDVVGNTLTGEVSEICGPGISVTGAATGTALENNVIVGISAAYQSACATNSSVDLLVSADSAATTTEQYNVLSSDNGHTTEYEWAGADYTTVDAFQSATGKGAQDVIGLAPSDLFTASLPSSLPLIDSADANAPGETTTDIYGNARVDDASVANSGTGVGYYDRGAIEYQEYTSSDMRLTLEHAQQVYATVSLQGVPWGFVSESFDWGDGTTSQFSGTQTTTSTDFTDWFQNDHVYAARGTYTITETLTDAAGSRTLTGKINTAGSTYTPVTPTRVLDTRKGIGTGGSTKPVPSGSAIAFDVTNGVAGAPLAGTITAVVLNVTVTAPTSGGYITAYPDGTSRPTVSNMDFSAGETVPNLVTVKVGADGRVALYNGSGGTAHLIADVAGYYTATASGSGFVPVGPTRLLDTRKGTGTGGSTQPVPAGGTLNLKVAGNSPLPASGVSAVVLNVTVTAPVTGGYITVFPGGTSRPTVSNLDFAAGQTVPNLVTVPVGSNGAVSLYNGSGGTAHLIADVAGYYTKTGGHAFVPVNPLRVLDTRSGQGQDSAPHPVAAGGDQFMDMYGGEIITGTALVLNVTVTNPVTGGYITVHPQGTNLPTVSNLDFSAGQTVANLAISSYHGSLGPILHNGSGGTVNLIADAFGYFS